MTATITRAVSLEPDTRAAIYGLFAHAFAYPDSERIAAIHESADAVLALDAPMPLLRLAALARQAGRESLEPVYVSLTTFSSSPDCPAFETAYFGSEPLRQTQRMADIAGFYRAFGVDATAGGIRPDELPVELEFMAFLCTKEVYAIEHLGAPRTAQARKAQRVFLKEHLGRWGSVFARKISGQAPAGHFYALAGETLALWLEAECARMAVVPDLVSGEDLATWPSPVSHGPEFAGNANFVPMEELHVR